MPAWIQEVCPVANILRGIYAMDASTGIGVGEGGSIVRCAGGAPWASMVSPTLNTLRAVSGANVQNEDMVWAAGDAGTILKSDDGGVTWTVEPNTGAGQYHSISMLAFGTGVRGIAVGQSGAARLHGGNSWANLPYPWPGHHLHGVCLVLTPGVGMGWEAWAAGYNSATGSGILAKYANNAWVNYSPANAPKFWEVHLLNPSLGVAAADGGAIYRKGAGNSWVKATTPAGNGKLMGIVMADATNGYAVGAAGAIVGTTNGGTSWTNMANPMAAPKPDLNSVDAAASMPAWAHGHPSGGSGTILKYS